MEQTKVYGSQFVGCQMGLDAQMSDRARRRLRSPHSLSLIPVSRIWTDASTRLFRDKSKKSGKEIQHFVCCDTSIKLLDQKVEGTFLMDFGCSVGEIVK